MNTETTPIEGDVLDSMPATQPPANTGSALAPASNPFLPLVATALEKGMVDQLERLFEMQMKWDADLQRKAFVIGMVGFKTEAGGITIAKSKHVSFTTARGKTEYMHAELHDITRALVPVMARHGLSHRWVPEQTGKDIKITCVVTHRDGHSESVSLVAQADDSGGKNSIQSIASTKTYLERYTLLAATGIATGGEDDDDGRSFGQPEPPKLVCITVDQAAALNDLMDAYVVNKPKFMDWIRGATKDDGVQTMADLQDCHFDLVHNKLGEIRKAKTEANAAKGNVNV